MNPKWKMIFHVANGEITSESDVSACDAEVWLETKSKWDGYDSGRDVVYYVDSDDLEVDDVPSAS